ncbi:Oidioi.mRNA.OKI2018_I69.PAR.g9943.t2.cds [Oikopleura dioica]|uniref:Oidioi.mRNA.OKI2018_I69.PAR.g9943.t2.cds n=1 Tax=Oikopleura dioica TaxID=34765 RepID=A0ABN7RSE0_OIKDI|nr:Oidioi.mRNA.OKI2018_I69.PAR.g9943.t2.cds [Oikopleura dioica]
MKKKPILLYICLLQCLFTQVLGQDGDRQEVVGGMLSSELEVVDNGYRHLNVIISSKIQQEEICEDEEKRLNCKRTFKFIEKVKDFIKLLSKSIYEASRGHFYIESCNIIMPKSWDAPPANETEALNFGGTISYIDFDAIPIRIYPDMGESGFSEYKAGPVSRDLISVNVWNKNRRSMQNKLTGEKLVRRPYAVKATPCGYQGSYLRMSQAFIEDPQSLNFTAYGNPEKILAGEWAKFRWGVFDETPPPNKGHEFYLASNSRIEASRCSLKVEGDLILKEDTEDGRIKGDECMRMEAFQSRNLCEFVPKKQQKQSGLGSLLFSRHLDDVTEYCDNDPEKKLTFHNRDAKTRHNEVCDTKSIWEVIRAHDDFIKGAKGKPVRDFDSTNKGLWMNTKFTVMRQNNTKTVLTIDTSTSMGVGKRWENVKKAASQYLSALPHDAHVGIVFFARRAYQRTRGLIQIENGDSSELLRRRLESVPLNLGTSIGHALQEAMKMLKTSGPMDSRDSGGSIILLSDGAESNAPFIDEDLIQELIDNRVTVNTIAFGKDASPKLEEVSKRTKGSSYFSDPENPSSILQDAFIAELQKDGSNAHPIVSVKRAINAGSTEEFDFKIDQTIGKDTKITISYETNAEKDNRPEIKINTPGYPRPIIADMQNKVSESINPETGEPAYTVAWRENLEDGLITVDLTGKADNGTYTIYVKNDHSSPASVHINVVSYAREPDREPVTLTPTIIQKKIAPSNTDIVVIYAAFAQGEFPILFADLWAEVTFPLERNGTIMTTETVILTDDGKHDDVIANDGIYTGIFTNIFETGRYSIKVRANGDNGKAVVSKGHMLGIGELDDAEYEVVENAVHKEVWQTTRRRKRRNVRTTRDRRQSDGEEDYEYDDGEEGVEEEPPKRVEIPVISLKEPATNQDRVELNKQLEAQKLARLTRVSAQDTERVTNLDTIVIEASETDLCDEGFFHFDGFCYFISRDVQEQKNFKEAEDACAEMGAELIDIRTLQVAQYFLVTLRARIKDFWASDVNDKIVNHIPLLIDNIYSVTEVQAILDGLLGRVAKEFYLRKKDQENSFARMASIRQHRDPDFDRDIRRLYEDLTKNIQVPMTYLQRRIFEKHKKTVDELSQEEIEEIKNEWKGKQLQKLDHFKEQLIDREKFEFRSPRFLASFERAKREIDSLQFGPCRYKDIFHRYRKNRKFAICHSEKPVICQLISPKNAHNRNCPGNWTDFEGHFDSSDICYHFNETKRNFFEAEKYCQEKGGTLLRINCANKEVFEIKEEKIDTFWISNMDTSGLNDLQCSKMSEEIIRKAESTIPEPEEPTASGMQMDVFVNKPVFTFGKTGANAFARSEVVEDEEGASTTTTSATTTSTTITTSTTSTEMPSSTTTSDPLDSEENDPAEGEEIDDGVYDDDDDNEEDDDDDVEEDEYNSNDVYEEMINQNPTEVPIVDVEGETYCMWFDGQLREVTNDFLCKNLKKNYICQKPKNDLLAPARIKDLDVQHFTSGSEKDPLGSFHIGFTATGNDDSQGRADRYEVRMVATEKGKEALRDDFDKGYHLQYSDFSNEITSRPDSPQKVGYYERLTIRFEHLAGCPRNQLMDLLVLVDTTQGNQTAGIELYLPAHTLKILTYIGNVYNIGPAPFIL